MKSFKTLVVIFLVLLSIDSQAQLSPFGTSFFQNLYLNNPAMAGNEIGINAGIVFRQQFNSVPGAPVNQVLTVEYGSQKNTGLGFNIYNDRSGLFKTTRVLGSYSYSVKLDGDNSLKFGLSLGFLNQRISNEDVDGDPNDFQLAEFSKRETYIDGDFGIAYVGSRLSAQLALPQLKNQLGREKPDLVNYSTFFSSISYKWPIANFAAIAEPKINYRGVKGSDNIADVGLNLGFAEQRLQLFGMYHTSESSTFGMGVNYKTLNITGMYATGTSVLRNYANGDFEINLQIAFPSKK